MEFLILGCLEVRRSRETIQIRGHRQRKLLALLLLNANHVVPIDALVDELWEDPPQTARPQVHNAVRDLRRDLSNAGESRLVTEDLGYRLVVPDDAVDAHRFTSGIRAAKAAERDGRVEESIRLLQSAVELWRGDAFAGIACPTLTAAGVKLDEQRLGAVEDLMALRLKSGESASLVGELHALLAANPLRESLRGTLMLALYRSGRQADALAAYEDGRRTLADDLGLDPGHRLRALHAQILAGAPGIGPAGNADIEVPLIPEQVRRRAEDRPPPPPGPRPVGLGNYLPHDLADFTGRRADLDRALALAARGRSGAPVMISIDGMGGVGKTSLAVHLAHRLTPSYPDGQFFVGLHGFSATREPLPPEQALGSLLRAGGLAPEAIPASLEERSDLWRSRLAGKKCLVVLDDAADTAVIRPLLPGTGGCLVLVTSRRKLTALDGADPILLGMFAKEDAMALFGRIVGAERMAREPVAAARAVELCGYLPLAVRIAATRLRDRAAWTVADLVDRLADSSRRIRFLQTSDRDLMSMLRTSYKHLGSAQRRFSRLISLHPASHFDVARAAVITGMPVDEVEHCFEVLLENNLVQQDSPGLFAFHDLVRDCSRELLVERSALGPPADALLVG